MVHPPLPFLTRVRLLCAAFILLCFWSVYALIMLPVSWWLRPRVEMDPDWRRVGQGLLRLIFLGARWILRRFRVVEYEYCGFEQLHSHPGPLLIAANHPAMWDAVFIIAEVGQLSCVMKASLMRNPWLIGGSVAGGLIPNVPSHSMLRACIQRLQAGERLLFFPEGTRTLRQQHGVMNPLVGGLAIVARQSGVPVWPIYVETNSAYLSKGWPIWKLPREKIRLRLTVGKPIHYQDHGSAEAFLQAVRNQFQQVLSETSSPRAGDSPSDPLPSS
jgi:1-acyl-sn-glycerol-3-phosphate acyltransferase